MTDKFACFSIQAPHKEYKVLGTLSRYREFRDVYQEEFTTLGIAVSKFDPVMCMTQHHVFIFIDCLEVEFLI